MQRPHALTVEQFSSRTIALTFVSLASLAMVSSFLIPAGFTPLLAQQPSSPSALADAARALRSGDLDLALSLLEPLRSTGDLGESGQNLLGSIYLEAGRAEEALALLQPLAAAPNASSTLLVDAGRAATRVGDPEQAAQLFTRALEVDPQSTAAKELGILFGAMGDYKNSYPLLLNWVRRFPDDGTARLLAALAAVELERPFEAGQLLDSLDQNDARVQQLRGKALVQLGKGEEAIPILQPLLARVHPDQVADLRHALADAYLLADQPLGAVELIEGNVGDDISLAIKLSEAFERSGYDASAASVIKRFVEPLSERLDELPPELIENAADMALRYGRLMLATEKLDEARSYLEVATKLDSDNDQAWRLYSQALNQAGEAQAAAAASARANDVAKIAPSEPDDDAVAVLDDTGRKIREATLLSRSDATAALLALQAESQIVPGDPRPPLAAARILFNLSQFPEAQVTVDFALSLVPPGAEAAAREDVVWKQLRIRGLSLKARISASLNELEPARLALRELLELDPENEQAKLRLQRLNTQP